MRRPVGISDNERLKHWHSKPIRDDPNLRRGVHRHYLSFAGGGPNSRTTQLFIAFEDLDFLGNEPWETPFGIVHSFSAENNTLDQLFKGYGDIPPFGSGPDQQRVFQYGNAYLRQDFPQLDYILSCRLVSGQEAASVFTERDGSCTNDECLSMYEADDTEGSL
jgi:cyclophilin family peptidyl-prolyl cis-trans isomerase